MNHSTSSINITILSTITTTLTAPYQNRSTSFARSPSRSPYLAFNTTATPMITITQTHFKTRTVPPASFSLPSFSSSIPLYTTTTTTSTHHDPQSTYLALLPFDDTQAPWHQLFPALIVFALIGVLSALACLLLCLLYVYRRYYPPKEEEQGIHPSMQGAHWHLPPHDPPDSSTHFVPIASSPLTLVPRAAIWKDPERRRGVNEMDLWEQKHQQQQQSAQTPPLPPQHALPLPFLTQPNEDGDDDNNNGSDDDDDDENDKGKRRRWTNHTIDSIDDDDSYLDDGRDRPWQRYMQQQQQTYPVSDLARAITVAALDNDGQHSVESSSFGSVFHSRLDSMGDQTGSVNRSSSH